MIIRNERAAKNNSFPVSLRVIFDSYFTALQAHCPRQVKQTMAVLYLAGRHFPSAASLYSGSQPCGKSVSACRCCGGFDGCGLVCGTELYGIGRSWVWRSWPPRRGTAWCRRWELCGAKTGDTAGHIPHGGPKCSSPVFINLADCCCRTIDPESNYLSEFCKVY